MSRDNQLREGGSVAAWRRLSLAGGALCLVTVFGLALGPDTPEFFVGQDKVNHVVAFCCLGFLFSLGASIPGIIRCGVALTVAAFAVEVMQGALTLNREGSFGDAFASLGGLAMGMAMAITIGAVARAVSPATAQVVSR
ncbi:MAG: hypothetical protein AB7T59_01585 [Hyphomonadaceae bacterium]